MLDDAACRHTVLRIQRQRGSAEGIGQDVTKPGSQTKMTVTLWLPSLRLNAKLTIERLDFLTISGNQSKHNLWRLTGVSERLVRIFSDNG